MIREHCCAICTPKMNIKICGYCKKRLKRISEGNYLFFKNFKNGKLKFYICEKCFKEEKMIKNIYDKYNKQYRHEYFCDNCFAEMTYGRVYRNEGLMKHNKFDLCFKCYKYYEIKM